MTLTDFRHYDVLVIGGGFAGVAAAVRLREAGITDFAVLEKGAQLGGTWRDNTYPGCACDVPSVLYQFSFAPKPDWSRAFAGQAEIQAYLLAVAEDFGVNDHVHLETEVLEAAWDDDAQHWEVQTSAGPYVARALIAGAGPLHEPRLPDVAGLDEFEGTAFHSARWDHGHDLRDRRVAVIGTGSSAIQFLPEIAALPRRLTLFQRTAPWVLPKLDRRIPAAEQQLFRRVPAAQRAMRTATYRLMEGLGWLQRHERVMARVEGVLARHMKRSVADPELRRICTPQFTLGCKRMLFSNDWYPALQRANVEVVPHGVERLTRTGIVGTDGVERPVDTVIFGTGFHVTDPPIAERLRGRDGRTMAESWNGSPRAYLGTAVAGFPNLFMLIGPNTGNGHTSALLLIEAQLRYAIEGLRLLRRDRLASLEVSPEAVAAFNADVDAALAGTVWSAGGCASYYADATGRVAAIYPWSVSDLERRTARFDAERYRARPLEVGAAQPT
jgi:cation diffusion facilitator CzcD-associated flavoprotein CzcO